MTPRGAKHERQRAAAQKTAMHQLLRSAGVMIAALIAILGMMSAVLVIVQ